MLGWLEDRLRKISEKHPAGSEKHFQVSVSRSQVGTATMLERAGYDPVRIFYQMARPTLDDIPDFPLPVGLEIRPATPDQYRAIWESAVETGRDEWGSGEPAIDAYDEWLSQPYFQPHLWQIAWDIDADTVAGHVLTYINDDENKQFDRRRGYTEGIGVVREWRRRGVARALIAMSLRAQKAVGMAESALVADSASADDAVRLYKSCGFQIVEADTIYRKPFVSRIAG
jgi:ribosomal protein S18 acetylase RimI-like enzyme